MTITRLITTGFERQSEKDARTTLVAGAVSLAGYGLNLGYGIAINFTSEGLYWTLGSAISQCRASFCAIIPVGGEFSGDTPSIFTLGSGGLGTKALELYYTAGSWYVYAGATQLGTFADTMRFEDWFHIGIDFKIDAASGWCYVYFNGVAMLSYSGKTDYGAATFDTPCLGPNLNGDNWAALFYLDNFYFDDSTGEGATAAVPMSLFKSLRPNTNGNYSDWVGSDGNSVNNYQLIFDTYNTTLATVMSLYVEGTTTGDQDSYALDAQNIHPSYAFLTDASDIIAVHHRMCGLEEAATSEQYRPFLRYSGTDDTGTLVDLGTSVDMYDESFPLAPGGGAWGYDEIADLEAGVEVV